jgi:hypothetical protein
MIGRRATLGLSLLSALLVCALVAQSASAIEATKSKRTTAFTCVPGTGEKDFQTHIVIPTIQLIPNGQLWSCGIQR